MWNPWGGGQQSGTITNIEIEGLFFNYFTTGIYIVGSQQNKIKDCSFNSCIRCITTKSLGYLLHIDHCLFAATAGIGTSSGNPTTEHCWCVGAFSEMVTMRDCQGAGGTWAIASAGIGSTLQMDHCYFDCGANGVLYGQETYSIILINCSMFQEFQSILRGIIYTSQVRTMTVIGGAISAMGFAGAMITILTGTPGSVGPALATISHSYNTFFYNYGQTEPYFSFGGNYCQNPVEVRGYGPDIQEFADPGAAPTTWLDSAGVGPLVFPALQAGLWTTNFPAAGTYALPGNNF